MFKKRLEIFFIVMILASVALLGINYYKDYSFKHNPLPKSYLKRITNKEKDVLAHMIIITDKIPGRLYGLTSYEGGHITIYLNKKVMQESMKVRTLETLAANL